MASEQSVHSHLSAHAVFHPPQIRRRCLVCVREQILGILGFCGPISPLLYPSWVWFCILAGQCPRALSLFRVMLPSYLGNARQNTFCK